MWVNGLPTNSATWAAVSGLPQGLTMTDLLLMDLWSATTGEEHPARPKRQRRAAGEASAIAARLKAQQRRLSVAPPPDPA